MADSDKKQPPRPRGENWQVQERLELLDLIKCRINHIENKGTDSDKIRKKKDAWTEIYGEFCCKFGEKRPLQKVKVSLCTLILP
jgi:hypothetical protein